MRHCIWKGREREPDWCQENTAEGGVHGGERVVERKREIKGKGRERSRGEEKAKSFRENLGGRIVQEKTVGGREKGGE